MKRCPCGKYWLGRDTVCPHCGYTMTKSEWKAHVKEQKAERRAEKKAKQKELRKAARCVMFFTKAFWISFAVGLFVEPALVVTFFSFFGMIISVIVRRITRTPEEAAALREKKEKRQKELEEYNSPEKKAEREEQKRQALAQRRKNAAAAQARKADDHRAVSAVLISTLDETRSKKSAVGAAGRAVVGGALLGPVGALAGAATTKSNTKVVGQKATFSVKYASGRTGTETVDVRSKRFNELSALLHK